MKKGILITLLLALACFALAIKQRVNVRQNTESAHDIASSVSQERASEKADCSRKVEILQQDKRRAYDAYRSTGSQQYYDLYLNADVRLRIATMDCFGR